MRVLSFNILAPCWVGETYRGIEDALLEAGSRRVKVCQVIARSRADVVCLQEVQADQVSLLRECLGDEFDVSELAENRPTSAPIPNGVLMLTRRRRVLVHQLQPSVWNSEGSAAYLLEGTFLPSGRRFVAVNSHVAWGEPGEDQMTKTRSHLEATYCWPEADVDVVWCGDFNATPETPAVKKLKAVGFSDSLDFRADIHTFHAPELNLAWDLQSKRVDYVFSSGRLQVSESSTLCTPPTGFSAMEQADRCRWCLKEFGSDHTPVIAVFRCDETPGKAASCRSGVLRAVASWWWPCPLRRTCWRAPARSA
mmetsp:Transcript_87024/g.241348  ORF Transcript_87024/g.241348 Transcript_87024/m.241348 type:complete len:309 (-) Transcript_87024:86-1012(-)